MIDISVHEHAHVNGETDYDVFVLDTTFSGYESRITIYGSCVEVEIFDGLKVLAEKLYRCGGGFNFTKAVGCAVEYLADHNARLALDRGETDYYAAYTRVRDTLAAELANLLK